MLEDRRKYQHGRNQITSNRPNPNLSMMNVLAAQQKRLPFVIHDNIINIIATLAFYCADTASVQLTAYVQLMYPNLTSVFSFSGIAIPHWYPRCKNKMCDRRRIIVWEETLCTLCLMKN